MQLGNKLSIFFVNRRNAFKFWRHNLAASVVSLLRWSPDEQLTIDLLRILAASVVSFCGDCLTEQLTIAFAFFSSSARTFQGFQLVRYSAIKTIMSRPSRLLFRRFWWISSITELKWLWLLFKWITLIKKENCQWNKWILRLWRPRRIYGIT